MVSTIEGGGVAQVRKGSSARIKLEERGERAHARRRLFQLAIPETRPSRSLAVLVAADFVALTVAGFTAVGVRYAVRQDLHPVLYLSLWPVLVLLLVVYALLGLYSLESPSPAERLRRFTLGTTGVFGLLAVETFLLHPETLYSRSIIAGSLLLTLALVPLFRSFVTAIFCSKRWWGHPVVVLGAGKTGREIIRGLRQNPGIGLKPVAFLDDDPGKALKRHGVPVLGGLDLAQKVTDELGVTHAIVAMPGMSREQLTPMVRRMSQVFERDLVLPDPAGLSRLWLGAQDVTGLAGDEVVCKSLGTWARGTKRALDIAVAVIAGLLTAPVLGLIALAVRLDSKGPIFYGHTRWGRGGTKFKMWKFRSMAKNADELLKKYLAENPKLRLEWELTQKLREDPRITRVGRFLRRTSLDELPQIWNVLVGDMGIVGPRPVPLGETPKYEQSGQFSTYMLVKPGITGLWQVSGRNDLSYDERILLNSYYVRNWTVWLDLYIMARTVPVVSFGKGAC